MSAQIWLAGSLKDHARGRRLVDLTRAITTAIPDRGTGACLFFGGEFQKLDKEAQSKWMDWSQMPGRLFLLLPPFQAGAITPLLDWEILGVGSAFDSLAHPLAQRLSSEVRFQLKGTFQIPAKPSGLWDNGTVNTCFFRRHPHAGLFAATCLPLWSLALLDARAELREWLSDLLALSGKPIEEEPTISRVFDLNPEHYALLLFLCSTEFASDDDALRALPKSEIFRLPGTSARQYLTELETQGFVRNGHLTSAGRSALAASPYQAYAVELEVQSR